MSSLTAVRQSLSLAARASLRNTSSTFRAGSRRMNSSHASHTKSDKPWIIGSAILFGPAFLYLVSPSARKNTGHVHNDAHDFPGHKKHAPAPAIKEAAPEPEPEPAATEPEPAVMKDAEGTEANIAESIAASADDVPKADPVGQQTAPEPAPEAAEPKSAETEATTDNSGSFQPSGAEVATDLGEARTGATEGVEPKKASESA